MMSIRRTCFSVKAMNDIDLETPACPRCRIRIAADSRFCPHCGKRIVAVSRSVRLKQAAFTLVIAALVWPVIWIFQGYLKGPVPSVSYQQMLAETRSQEEPPEIAELRAAVRLDPNDDAKLRQLAEGLIKRINNQERPNPGNVLEVIDMLSQLLKTDPNDTFALQAMAELSFQQQVFSKAAEYYERYLALKPADYVARGRYASALTFTGEAKLAIEQLNGILLSVPGDFHALAYLSVAYAQSGQRDKALEAGQRAIAGAPSQEAKERLTKFLESLKDEKTAIALSTAQAASGSTPELAAVSTYLENHPIAGSHFRRASIESGGILLLLFDDFPVEQMPEGARDSFIKSIRTKVEESGVAQLTQIVIADARSGRENFRVNLRPRK